uniref:Large ribosomal subunit protein uL23c n=1 Tax=Triparma laevis TaxID=1534972 RepID=A0A0K2RW83_9STRA|nr:chloroplast 50S ribosomal protein L23 [Triparma laevis]BAS19106.1 chloroplast 50S ribosomal protein L23 [Triparma laevis]
MIKSLFDSRSAGNIIKYPIITDKATRLLENNKYSFIVDPKSDKLTIKHSIEYLFDVKVIKVNTCQLPKKKRRVGKYVGWKSHYKKAIVTLSEGNTINLFAEN